MREQMFARKETNMAIKIMLDAGHYAKYNQSPVVPAYWESEMTWKLHLYLKEELERYGCTVLTTREKQEVDLPVYDRGKAAKGCDLFLSLHSNAASAEYVDRVVVYRAFDNRNNADALAGKLSAAIAELMGVSAGYVSTRESDTYPGTEYYGVMRGARKVNVPLYYIVEHSFHTNRKATEWLLKDDNLRRLAILEAGIIAGYYGIELPPADKPVKGDIDGNGVLNTLDYMLLKRAVLGTVKLTDAQKEIADVNHDGKVDVIDYTLVKRAVLGTFTL